MGERALKVGELARRTGLTVRTLHHYEAVGLLQPTLRTEAGHRLYTTADMARLQQVLSLRQLGFSLEEVHDCLNRRGAPPLEVIRLHVHRLRTQIDMQRELVERLEGLARHLAAAEEISADELLRTIEVMKMTESYYTPEQMEYLQRRREEVGEERMQQAPADWERLTADVRAEMEAGTDPTDPKAQALARRWQGLIDEFTGGDPGIADSLRRMWQERGDQIAAQHGMGYDPRLFEFMGKALEALKASG